MLARLPAFTGFATLWADPLEESHAPDESRRRVTPSPTERRVTVDGEIFDVHLREDRSAYDFEWVSGPNPGYGFTIGQASESAPDGHPAPPIAAMDDLWIRAKIRSFLGSIDPTTGYMAD